MALTQAFRWGIKSVGGLIVNLTLLTVWVDYLYIWPEVAIGINWVVVSIAGYVVTDRWVFQDGDSPETGIGTIKRYLSMQGIMASSKVVNYAIYIVLLHVVDYRIAWTIGAVTVFLYTFGGNRKLWSAA